MPWGCLPRMSSGLSVRPQVTESTKRYAHGHLGCEGGVQSPSLTHCGPQGWLPAPAAIENFTESLRVELKHTQVDIALCQGHMPGVNTPQFDWVLHRGIEHHPMPVPPIYQPEVAARAVAHVAEHPRRTMWVGLPTALTILGNRVAPSLLDWYLAKTNVMGQQSPDHDPPGEQSNTWKPVYGAEVRVHGNFDEQAHAHSPELWISRAAAARKRKQAK